MESRHIRRGIESRHARAQTGPNIGHVARLREDGSAGGGRRSFRMRDVGRAAFRVLQQRAMLTWSIMLSLVTVVVVGGFMMFWLRGHRGQLADAQQANVASVRLSSRFPSPSEDEALRMVREALAVDDPAKIDRYFRRGSATAEEIVIFLRETVKVHGKVSECIWLSSMDVEDLLLDGVLVMYAKAVPQSERVAFLTPDTTGQWRIDFEAFARSHHPSWRDFLNGSSETAQVRVFMARDTYFNGPFSDDHQWACFGMVAPEAKEFLPEDRDLLHGYCRIGSSQAKAMDRIFSGDHKIRRATVEIRRMAEAPMQFEITRVLAEDWVLPLRPFDEKFAHLR